MTAAITLPYAHTIKSLTKGAVDKKRQLITGLSALFFFVKNKRNNATMRLKDLKVEKGQQGIKNGSVPQL